MLDGQLDEPCWQISPKIDLTSIREGNAVEKYPSSIQWSFDDQYVYIAITANRNSSLPVAALRQRRAYDSDLTGVDHISFTLDTDRDYMTATELAVADDGRTYDRCVGNVSFNPKWHVAVQPTQEKWIAEVAIPISTLTTRDDISGQAWAITAQRVDAMGKRQSWSQLRTEQKLLQAAGLLLFTPRAAIQSVPESQSLEGGGTNSQVD